MRILILGGSGFVGQHLGHSLANAGHIVCSTGTNPQNSTQNNIKQIAWDASQENTLLSILMESDVVINLVGANIAKGRWSAVRKQVIVQSRTQACKSLNLALQNLHENNYPLPNTIIQASACGYYGLFDQVQSAPICTEDSPRGLGFLARTCEVWESQCIKLPPNVRQCIIRLAPVLGNALSKDTSKQKLAGFLASMTPPFQYYLGGVLGNGKQPLPWIHIRDVIKIINFLIHEKDVHGIFNVCAPHTQSMDDFVQTLAHVLKKPALLHVPSFILKLALGQMAEELILSGQVVIPKRLNELGFNFDFPHLRMALEEVFRTK